MYFFNSTKVRSENMTRCESVSVHLGARGSEAEDKGIKPGQDLFS